MDESGTVINTPGKPSSPYQVLSDFFKQKKAEPLSEVEAAGVISLINNCISTPESQGQAEGLATPTPRGKSIHTPSPGFGTYSISPQTSAKRQRTIHLTNSEKPITTPKRSREDSEFKPHKIKRLSSIPTPYRPQVYLTQNDTIEKDDKDTELPPVEPKVNNSVATAKETSKISNTASTMLSLIDTDEDEKPAQEEPTKRFVNPYSSQASRSTPKSYKTNTKLQLTPSTPRSSNGIIKNLERSMPKSRSSSPAGTPSKPSALTENSSLLSKSSSGGSPALQRKPNQQYQKSYKPTRSSGLRKSLIVSPEFSGLDDSTGSKETRNGLISSASTIADHPKITPRWSVPDFDDDEDDTKIFVKDKTDSRENMVSPSKPLYPKVSSIGLDSTKSDASSSNSDRSQDPKKSTDFKFGVVVPSNDATSTEKPKLFSFSSAPMSNSAPVQSSKAHTTENKLKTVNETSGSLFSSTSKAVKLEIKDNKTEKKQEFVADKPMKNSQSINAPRNNSVGTEIIFSFPEIELVAGPSHVDLSEIQRLKEKVFVFP